MRFGQIPMCGSGTSLGEGAFQGWCPRRRCTAEMSSKRKASKTAVNVGAGAGKDQAEPPTLMESKEDDIYPATMTEAQGTLA
jgi:hypothetical protein